MISREEMFEKLKTVRYPGFSRDIVSFGIIKDAQLNEGNIKITLSFTSESPEKRLQIQEGVRDCLKSYGNVAFEISEAPQKPAADRATLEQRAIPGVKHIITVASGKGGVGKSTVSVNLACSLQSLGRKVGLLDADIYGPSIPMMMGVHEQPEMSDDKKIFPHHAHGVSLMSIGFFVGPDSPVIWRGPMITGAIRQLMYDTQWGDLDYLIVDLPPGTGDAQLSLVQMAPVQGSVIVTTPQDVALLDAKKGVAMFQRLEVKILGIIENMSIFICPHCHGKTDIFSQGGGAREAERLKVPFLGEIPIEPAIRIGSDNGTPVVIQYPQSEVARAFLKAAKAVDSAFPNM